MVVVADPWSEYIREAHKYAKVARSAGFDRCRIGPDLPGGDIQAMVVSLRYLLASGPTVTSRSGNAYVTEDSGHEPPGEERVAPLARLLYDAGWIAAQREALREGLLRTEAGRQELETWRDPDRAAYEALARLTRKRLGCSPESVAQRVEDRTLRQLGIPPRNVWADY